MVYGILKFINFAHGDIYMLGAYIGFAVTTFLHVGFIPAILISMVSCGIIGIVIEKIAYKPIRNSSRISALITAIAVSLFLEYGTMYFVKAETRTFPEVLTNKSIRFLNGSVVITTTDIYIITITIVLMVLLEYVVKTTKMGKAMRAVSTDMEAAQYMGISIDKTISFTFAVGSALAGVAGVLVGVYYNSINPLMGVMPGLKAFIAAVLGGIGIIPGAVIGGYFLGMTETIVSAYGASMFKDAVSFIILIIILLVRPNGILGKNVKEKV